MAKVPLSECSTEQLEARAKAVRSVHYTTIGIFAVSVLGWIAPGHWRENTPVFMSTVVMAVAITTMQHASRSTLEKELQRRRDVAR